MCLLYTHTRYVQFLNANYHRHSYFCSSDVDDRYLDPRLSLTLEETLRDVILADASDYGVDLAVGKISVIYQPGTQRWEQLEYPNARWLTCTDDTTVDKPSQTVHINLFNGELRVNGRLLGGLPREAWASPECQQVFRDVCTCFNFRHQ